MYLLCTNNLYVFMCLRMFVLICLYHAVCSLLWATNFGTICQEWHFWVRRKEPTTLPLTSYCEEICLNIS